MSKEHLYMQNKKSHRHGFGCLAVRQYNIQASSTWLKCAFKKCENDAFEYIISEEKSVLMRKCAKYFKLSFTQMRLFQTAILSVEGNTIYLVRFFYSFFLRSSHLCHSYFCPILFSHVP